MCEWVCYFFCTHFGSIGSWVLLVIWDFENKFIEHTNTSTELEEYQTAHGWTWIRQCAFSFECISVREQPCECAHMNICVCTSGICLKQQQQRNKKSTKWICVYNICTDTPMNFNIYIYISVVFFFLSLSIKFCECASRKWVCWCDGFFSLELHLNINVLFCYIFFFGRVSRAHSLIVVCLN